mmetsp:Transcript_336/g.420  ORF Transcript_336/g.420 Transcript_336/m.420 type:complete len:500 (+) Transcript_336:93-1592(+)
MEQVKSLNSSMSNTSWAAEQLASAAERLAAVFHFIGAELQGVLGDFCLAQEAMNDDIRAVLELLLAWREVGEHGVVFAGSMLAVGTQARKIAVQVEFERAQRMKEAQKLRKVLAADAAEVSQVDNNARWRSWFGSRAAQRETETSSQRERESKRDRRDVAEACLEQLTRQMEATERRGREELSQVVKLVYQQAKPLGIRVSELRSSWRGAKREEDETTVPEASDNSAAWVFEFPRAADSASILASERLWQARTRSKGHSTSRQRRSSEKQTRRKSARRSRRVGADWESPLQDEQVGAPVEGAVETSMSDDADEGTFARRKADEVKGEIDAVPADETQEAPEAIDAGLEASVEEDDVVVQRAESGESSLGDLEDGSRHHPRLCTPDVELIGGDALDTEDIGSGAVDRADIALTEVDCAATCVDNPLDVSKEPLEGTLPEAVQEDEKQSIEQLAAPEPEPAPELTSPEEFAAVPAEPGDQAAPALEESSAEEACEEDVDDH